MKPSATGSATLSRGVVRGWLNWPADPFFRPTVAVFGGDRLLRIAPTWRDPDATGGSAAGTRCVFAISDLLRSEIESIRHGVVTCCESGLVLARFGDGETAKSVTSSGGPATVTDVINEGYARMTPYGGGGFETFLKLSILDQISILYQDVLVRAVDTTGIETYVQAILDRSLTILDVRDSLMRSAEFRAMTHTPASRIFGGWCTWPGLEEVAGKLMMPDFASHGIFEGRNAPSRFSGYLSAVAEEEDLGQHLARLACGDVGAAAHRSWRDAHAKSIARLKDEVQAERERRCAAASSADHSRTIELLGAMSAGTAGERKGAALRRKPGALGHIVHGPYILLDPGAYRVLVRVSIDVPDPAGHIFLELTAGEAVFGCGEIETGQVGTASAVFAATIPVEHGSLLRGARYEVRCSAVGDAEFGLVGVALEALPDEAAVPYPALGDLLSQMQCGADAARLPSGGIVVEGALTDGHSIFGPSIGLLPGRYAARLRVETAKEKPRPAPLAVDVAMNADAVLSAKVFHLKPGQNDIAIAFTVPTSGTADALDRSVEVRIVRPKPVRLEVHSLDIIALKPDGRAFAALANRLRRRLWRERRDGGL